MTSFNPTPSDPLHSFNHDSRTSKGANICSGEADMTAVARGCGDETRQRPSVACLYDLCMCAWYVDKEQFRWWWWWEGGVWRRQLGVAGGTILGRLKSLDSEPFVQVMNTSSTHPSCYGRSLARFRSRGRCCRDAPVLSTAHTTRFEGVA